MSRVHNTNANSSKYSAVRLNGQAFSAPRQDLIENVENSRPEIMRIGAPHVNRRQVSTNTQSNISKTSRTTTNQRGRGVSAAARSAPKSTAQSNSRPRNPRSTANYNVTAQSSSASTSETGISLDGNASSNFRGKASNFTSRRLDPQRKADPFSARAVAAGSFREAYNRGFPARIQHGGSGTNRLQWDVPLTTLNYMTLLPIVASGIKETTHPYSFVARQTFKEMVLGLPQRVIPIVGQVVRPIRAALATDNEDSFGGGLEALQQLSTAVGPELNSHVSSLLVPVARRANRPQWREKVFDTLQMLEENGGPDVVRMIKLKVPTYTSICI